MPKSGKTTTATSFPKALLLAFERGYSALPGILVQPMNTWSDMLRAMKQLKTEEAKQKFQTIVLDTADLMYESCEKHVCNLHGVEQIGDIPYGAGYSEAAKLFDGVLQNLARLGYGIVLISHAEDKTIKDEAGKEYQRIRPTLSNTPRKVVNRFCDIIGYSRISMIQDEETKEEVDKTYLYLRATTRYEAGSRFKYMVPYIEFTYENLVNAIADAVEAEEKASQGSVTDQKLEVYKETKRNYSEVYNCFLDLTDQLIAKDEKNISLIIQIVEKHLGKGRKVGELGIGNADIIDVINEDLKELL